ncbi:MAG: hypothetical protein JOS17DRAFT_740534 [Linnemannia elongata]|nr:MAG: hypothetical protein JOS17DRAFT_740534 [Linnemannia elongata]
MDTLEEVQRQVQMSSFPIQIRSNWTEARHRETWHGIQSGALLFLAPSSCWSLICFPFLCMCSVCSVWMQASHFPFLPPSYKCGAIFSPDHIFLFFLFFLFF